MPIRVHLAASTCLFVFVAIATTHEEGVPDRDMLTPYPHPKGYVCYRTQAPITIDGKITESAWEAAPSGRMRSWTSRETSDPSRNIALVPRCFWDDKHCILPRRSRNRTFGRHFKEHDSIIFNDNDFEVFINPSGDNHSYCEPGNERSEYHLGFVPEQTVQGSGKSVAPVGKSLV